MESSSSGRISVVEPTNLRATNLQAAPAVSRHVAGRVVAISTGRIPCNHPVVMHPANEVRVNSAIRLRALVIRQQRHRQSGANREDQIRRPVGQVFMERFWFDAHNTLTIEATSQ